MIKIINYDLNEEERKVIETFISDYKAYNWLTLAWRNFDGQCGYYSANKIVDRLIIPSIKKVETEYGILKEKFIDYWNLQDEERNELERIVDSEKTEYWDRYFTHDFDGNEEEAMIDFFKWWETKMKKLFNIKLVKRKRE